MKIQVATTFVAHEFVDFNEPQLLSKHFVLNLPQTWTMSFNDGSRHDSNFSLNRCGKSFFSLKKPPL